ncbi:hypothetical protein B0T25DRAFT_543176 [Lasiosphaeria hispida]|uniref:Uncharacterized protein n=1 Tax=Lasiosphaeria hispida TaxID=260671 RepID=A0AAJ0HI78_9PEZI|nr:hypothetical protein B0T25DRAFT_543176 [Lasiosphaeria hispida]
MDPPNRRQSQGPASPHTGFASPTQDYARLNSKFVDDCTRMTFAVQQSMPESVRRIVRDNWEKCLLGSEFHQAFIVSTRISCLSVYRFVNIARPFSTAFPNSRAAPS